MAVHEPCDILLAISKQFYYRSDNQLLINLVFLVFAINWQHCHDMQVTNSMIVSIWVGFWVTIQELTLHLSNNQEIFCDPSNINYKHFLTKISRLQ